MLTNETFLFKLIVCTTQANKRQQVYEIKKAETMQWFQLF